MILTQREARKYGLSTSNMPIVGMAEEWIASNWDNSEISPEQPVEQFVPDFSEEEILP